MVDSGHRLRSEKREHRLDWCIRVTARRAPAYDGLIGLDGTRKPIARSDLGK